MSKRTYGAISQTAMVPRKKSKARKSSYKMSLRSTRYRLQSKVVAIPMSSQDTFNLNDFSGFNGLGFSLVFCVTARRPLFSIGGLPFTSGSAFTNAVNSQLLFDEFKIASCSQRIFFSATEYTAQESIALQGQPLLYACVDYTDADVVANANDILGYGNHQIIPLGGQRNVHTVYGGKLGVQFSTDTPSALGTTVLGSTKRAPWCRTAAALDVEHNGFKYWAQPAGNAGNVIGLMTVVTDVIFHFRNMN